MKLIELGEHARLRDYGPGAGGSVREAARKRVTMSANLAAVLCTVMTAGMVFLGVPIVAAAPPPPQDPDPAALQLAARAAIARGVTYLKDRAAADPDGWIAPPYRTRVAIGTTNVTVRYRERKTPKYEYETYATYERRPGASSVDTAVVPVQRQRIKRVIDLEGGPVELAEDPKGSIQKTVTRSVYGPGGPDYWRLGMLGQNAMALYALRVAGVPADDTVAQGTAEKLRTFVQSYGMPDATCELAWFAAGFARMPGKDAEELTQQLASKLLDGQITEGAARGLWGPVCINLPLLASLCLREPALVESLQKAREAEKGLPEHKRPGPRVAKMEAELDALQADIRRVSMLASQYDRIDKEEIPLGKDDARISVWGVPDYIFNQTSADIECTALVLFALREVARAGRMPDQTWRPEAGRKSGMSGRPQAARVVNQAPVPPESAEPVLARAANAIAQLQKPDGKWTESNMHQPVKAFDGLGKQVAGVPVKAGSFKPLPSVQTPYSSLCGYSALADIADIVGYAKVQARFQPKFAAGAVQAAASAESLPDCRPEATVGGFTPPFDAYFFAGNALIDPGTSRLASSNAVLRMVADVVSRLGRDGAWGAVDGTKRSSLIFASTRARMATLDVMDRKKGAIVMDRSVAHIRANWGAAPHRTVYADVLATSYALAFLANHARPPLTVCRVGEGALPATTLEPALRALEKQVGVPWLYRELTWPPSPSDLEMAPLLFVSGTGAFSADDAARSALAGFFKRGGFAILQAPATAEGETFLQSAGSFLAACGQAEPLGDVSSDARVLGDLAGKLGGPLQGALRKDGSLVAALIPLAVAGPAAKNSFSPAATAKLTQALIERNLDPAMLAPDYAWNLGGLGDATNVYASAMATLRSPKAGKKAPAAEPAVTNPPPPVAAAQNQEEPAEAQAPALLPRAVAPDENF
jgi:hypothetical protein